MIRTEHLLEILKNILQKHFGYLPSILKGSRKELIDSTLRLIADLRLNRFDPFIESLEMFQLHFPGCLEVARRKPSQRILKILLKNLEDFPLRDQIQIYSILPLFPFPGEITKFLISKHTKISKTTEKDLLSCLVEIGTADGIQFCLDKVEDLDDSTHLHILSAISNRGISFDQETTRTLIQRFNEGTNVEIQAGYLSLSSYGDLDLSFSLLIKSLSKHPEPIVNAAIEALIRLDRFEQISQSLLDLYSTSRFYRLAMNVGKIHGIRYEKEEDPDILAQGMEILSYLLNEDSREAQIAALEVANYFARDSRVLDWVSSLLLSETNSDLLERVLIFLEKHPGDSIKQVLLKAYERDVFLIKSRVLELLAAYEDQELFEFFIEIVKKEEAEPSLSSRALLSASRGVPKGQEGILESYLKSDSTELQSSAITCLLNCCTEGMTAALERNYTRYSGKNRTLAAVTLFRLGIPYILDDLLGMLASEQAQDQKVAVEAIHEIYQFIQDTPVESISKEVVDLLEISYRETESRIAKESLLSIPEIAPFLQVRHLVLQGEMEEALRLLHPIGNEEHDSFFLELAKLVISRDMGMDIEPESCLRLINQDPECIAPYQILSDQHKKRKRKTEYLVNQLKLFEVVHGYNGEILGILNEFSQSEVGSHLFQKLMKIVQSGGLPRTYQLHHILAQVHLSLRNYHKSFRHMCYGFLTMDNEDYLIDFTTCAIKCGYLEKASAICVKSLELSRDAEVLRKLNLLNKKIQELTKSSS